jgi:hypothetical protein
MVVSVMKTQIEPSILICMELVVLLMPHPVIALELLVLFLEIISGENSANIPLLVTVLPV